MEKIDKVGRKRGTLNEGLYGGRKGHDATTILLLEELKNDICYTTRKYLIMFDYDAASWYARIIPNLSSILTRKKGMNKYITFVHGKTLQEARYTLKTAMGVSQDLYSHSKMYPIYGSGQGVMNSPNIWL
eukprot:7899411-Ditylum_brightwellii.AAC.1